MKLLRTIVDVRREEVAKVVALSLHFFTVIACYWFLKPLRSALTVGELGANSIAELKVITAVVSAGVVIAYSAGVRRLGRKRLAALVLGSFVWLFVLAGLLFQVAQPPRETFYAFYVAVDLFITVNMALFWGLVSDVVDPGAAHRLYGWIGVGGVLGGLVGSLTCHRVVEVVSPTVMTVAVATVSLALIPLALWTLHHPTARRDEGGVPTAAAQASTEVQRSVRLRHYVAWIGALVASYEFASAISDFTFHKSVELLFAEQGTLPSVGSQLAGLTRGILGEQGAATFIGMLGLEPGHSTLGGYFSEFFLTLNLLAVALQLLVTPFVLKHWGPRWGVLVLPLAFAVAGTGFLALPTLGVAAWLFTADNSLNYSLNQTSRQMLFLPVSAEVRYRALALTDILVQRSAKAVAGFALLGLSALHLAERADTLRWAMSLLLPIVVFWLISAWLTGRQNRALFSEPERDKERST